MTAQLAPLPNFRNWDNNGNPLFSGKLYTYAAGTTTPQASYTDASQVTPNTNPVILNSRGEASVWLDQTLMYKLVLQDSLGNTIWTQDQVSGGYVQVPQFQTYINNYVTQSYIGTTLWPRSTAEITAGVTPTNYAYIPGSFLRYGAKGDGVNDDTTALENAFLCNQRVYGGGPQYSYRTQHSLKLRQLTTPDGLSAGTNFDGQGCEIHFTANVAGITNATGAGISNCRVSNVTLYADIPNTNAALDLVDISHSSFNQVLITRGVAGTSNAWSYGIRLRISSSVCLWNRFFDIEANTVSTAFISIENTNCNQNIFFSAKLVNDFNILLPFGVKITGGGDNYFYDLDLEASFSTNGVGNAYGVNFNTGSQNRIYGMRTEGYSNSASFYGVNYAGSAGQNEVWGHYFIGFGAIASFTGLVAGNTYVAGGYNYVSSGSLTGLKGEIGWDSVTDRFKGTTNSGGQRLVVQSPALDAINMNGNAITNVAHNSSGWGTPTGALVVANFPGASASLTQCSNAIAAILNALLSSGQLGN